MFSFSGPNLEAEFHLGEIDTCESDGKYIAVKTDDDKRILLRADNLLLHRNIPELDFKKPDNTLPDEWSMTNSSLWSSIAFWPFCSRTAALGIHNYANFRTIHVNQLEEQLLERIPDYSQQVHPLVDFNRSSKTLRDYVLSGELWWAPRPLKAYKTPSGVDLNLAVLQAMRVSNIH